METIKKDIRKKSRQEILELRGWIDEYLSFLNRSSFKVGDKVWFETSKYGKVYGTVEKINPKSVSIKNTSAERGLFYDNRGWRVHPNLLFKEE